MTDAQWRADFASDANPHKAEIAAAIARGDQVAIRDIYAAKDGTTPWVLTPPALYRIGGTTGLRLVIEAGCSSADPAVASLCLTLRDMLQGGTTGLDLTDEDITGPGKALDQLVGSLPGDAAAHDAVKARILAAGSVATSRADRLGGYPTTLTLDDIARILRGA
ncbi:MAG: hypothetical protein U0790_00155 [Isosphaeraceae bacterium]